MHSSDFLQNDSRPDYREFSSASDADDSLSSFSARPILPKIDTSETNDHDWQWSHAESKDLDQQVSRQLLAEQESGPIGHPAIVASAPEHPVNTPPHVSIPLASSFSEGDISMSPAAMFLSAFGAPPHTMKAPSPDDEGQDIGGYTLGPIIGFGGFSTIRRASSCTGGTVAIKIVWRSDVARQSNPSLVRKRLDHESTVWQALSHEHILPLFSAIHTPFADFFVTLYCPAGTLFDILKRDGTPALPQDDAGMMFRQVVRGLRYMHEVAGMVHGDIKLENVLVDEMGVCRIGDFGMTRTIGDDEDGEDGVDKLDGKPDRVNGESLGCIVEDQHAARQRAQSSLPERPHHIIPALPPHLHQHYSGPRHRNSSPFPSTNSPSSSSCPAAEKFNPGSLPYAAPELLLPHSTSLRANPAQDIWALGVLLYALLTGRLPFSDSFEPRLQMKILHGVYDIPEKIGRGAEQVLQGCLESSVSDRWTIQMVDEVAWGVGWGEAGDAVTPPSQASSSPSLSATRVPSQSRSRSRGTPHAETVDETYQENEEGRSTLRPSALSSRRPSPPCISNSRSVSLFTPSASNASSPFHPLPSFSSFTASILGTNRPSPSSSNPNLSRGRKNSSALSDTSPSPSPERGRKANPRLPTMHLQSPLREVRSASRSPSSVVPMTPVDSVSDLQQLQVKSGEREVSRGRKAVRSPFVEHSTVGEPELDTVDEKAQWQMSPERLLKGRTDSSLVRWLEDSDVERESQLSGGKRGIRRSGSLPPTKVVPWSLMAGVGGAQSGQSSPSVHCSSLTGVGEFVSTPPISVAGSGRSKSVGFDSFDGGARCKRA